MLNGAHGQMKLLITRVDGLGDLCLTLPMLGWLKERRPDLRIQLLVQPYAADLARRCVWADEVLEWRDPSLEGSIQLFLEAAPDHILHVFPKQALAKAAKKAGIPTRSGVRGRMYHWLTCNQLLPLSRSRSHTHEGLLNIQLAAMALGLQAPDLETFHAHAPHWSGYRSQAAAAQEPFVLLHPLSHGNGREWPIQHFARLAHLLIEEGLSVVVGGSAEEAKRMAPQHMLFPAATRWEAGQYNLSGYMERIEQASAVVASGTGPLHIAGLAGVPTFGLFPPKWPVNSLRWSPVGTRVKIFEAAKDCQEKCNNTHCACMAAITPEALAEAIRAEATSA